MKSVINGWKRIASEEMFALKNEADKRISIAPSIIASSYLATCDTLYA